MQFPSRSLSHRERTVVSQLREAFHVTKRSGNNRATTVACQALMHFHDYR